MAGIFAELQALGFVALVLGIITALVYAAGEHFAVLLMAVPVIGACTLIAIRYGWPFYFLFKRTKPDLPTSDTTPAKPEPRSEPEANAAQTRAANMETVMLIPLFALALAAWTAFQVFQILLYGFIPKPWDLGAMTLGVPGILAIWLIAVFVVQDCFMRARLRARGWVRDWVDNLTMYGPAGVLAFCVFIIVMKSTPDGKPNLAFNDVQQFVVVGFGLFYLYNILFHTFVGKRADDYVNQAHGHGAVAASSREPETVVEEPLVLRVVGTPAGEHIRLKIGGKYLQAVPDGHDLLISRTGDTGFRFEPQKREVAAAA